MQRETTSNTRHLGVIMERLERVSLFLYQKIKFEKISLNTCNRIGDSKYCCLFLTFDVMILL